MSCTAGGDARKVHARRPPNVTAGTHWSKDTLGVPLDRPCPLRLDAAEQEKAVSRVNFPLSSYSVFREKNVSQEK
jgi:hypothetical protein